MKTYRKINEHDYEEVEVQEVETVNKINIKVIEKDIQELTDKLKEKKTLRDELLKIK